MFKRTKVTINKCLCNKNINISVSQGRILNPLMFILYVNDLFIDMSDYSIVSYGDDAAVISLVK